MARSSTPVQRWVLIEFQYQKFVLPMDEGMALFAAMSSMEPVDYNYDTKTWKHKKADSMPTLRAFSQVEYAQLSLEDPAS